MRALLIPATDSPTLVEIGEEAGALTKARALIGAALLLGYDPQTGDHVSLTDALLTQTGLASMIPKPAPTA